MIITCSCGKFISTDDTSPSIETFPIFAKALNVRDWPRKQTGCVDFIPSNRQWWKSWRSAWSSTPSHFLTSHLMRRSNTLPPSDVRYSPDPWQPPLSQSQAAPQAVTFPCLHYFAFSDCLHFFSLQGCDNSQFIKEVRATSVPQKVSNTEVWGFAEKFKKEIVLVVMTFVFIKLWGSKGQVERCRRSLPQGVFSKCIFKEIIPKSKHFDARGRFFSLLACFTIINCTNLSSKSLPFRPMSLLLLHSSLNIELSFTRLRCWR